MEPTDDLSIDTGASAHRVSQAIGSPDVSSEGGTVSCDGNSRASGVWNDDAPTLDRLSRPNSGVTFAKTAVAAIPCFAAGTLIRTVGGEVPVELLAVGDLVETRDNGPQPIRWMERRAVAAKGPLAPIVIDAGTLGDHRRLVVSPQLRIVVNDDVSGQMPGENTALMAAKDLVNGASIRVQEGHEVVYFHLLFDCHQMIWSEGHLTEPFRPGPPIMFGFDQENCCKICTIFPELGPEDVACNVQNVHFGLRPFGAKPLFS